VRGTEEHWSVNLLVLQRYPPLRRDDVPPLGRGGPTVDGESTSRQSFFFQLVTSKQSAKEKGREGLTEIGYRVW
jgi:hypothetical protein